MKPSVWRLFFFAVLTVHAAVAQDRPARVEINVPAGDVAVALQQMAAQTSLQIIFRPDALAGVQARAVHGSYFAQEALDLLLVGTPLVAVPDRASGAFAVIFRDTVRDARAPVASSRSDPSSKSGADTPGAQEPQENPMHTKRSLVSRIFGTLFSNGDAEASKSAASKKTAASLRAAVGLAVVSVAGVPATAQAQGGVGTVEGRVSNAVTSRYLNNARVTLRQSNQIALTDEAGYFRLTRVPSGPVVIDVFYSGLDTQQISLNVPAGGVVTRDVGLTSAALHGTQDPTVVLDAFTVEALKETDNAVIAINDQRFAPNIKYVISTDAYGEVMGGNIGELLKFVPGIDTGGGAGEAGSISVRGFNSDMTQVTSDGAPMGARVMDHSQTVVNNLSRVEVTKVPTPATPADSVAGSVNLVSKSAFERDRRELRYNVSLTGSRRQLKLNKQPRADETFTRMVNPSANAELILPITKNFGVTFTALHYMANIPYNAPNRTYNATAANTGATFANPFLQQLNTQITTQFRTRDSASVRLDWRVKRNSVISAGYQHTYYKVDSLNYNFQGNVGTNPTPTVAGGTPLTFGPTFTHGATGRGSIGQTVGFNTAFDWRSSGNLNYRFDNGEWRADALFAASKAKSWTTREDEGYFGGFTTAAKVPVRISFLDIDQFGPGKAEVFTNTNQPWDMYDINNYNLTGVSGGRRDQVDYMIAGHVNVKKRLNFLRFPAAVQTGWAGRSMRRDLQNYTRNYTYTPANGDLSASAFRAVIYDNIKEPLMTGIERNPPPGEGVAYASPHLAYGAYKRNPTLFTTTAAQDVAMESGRRSNSLYFEEGVDALYLQGEGRILSNRLTVLTGVRWEKTTTYGQGLLNDPNAVWMRNADGSFARTPAGARIRKPEAGATGSIEQLNLTHQERGHRVSRAYDDYYPSLHFTYDIRENFLARLAYAKTYGRPAIANIVPNTVINEADLGAEPDPNAVQGTLTVRNTGLLPWTADGYDFSLEYYTNSGGLFGASVFHKDIKNFFGTFSKVANAADIAALELDPAYVGWQVNTTINTGDSTVSGWELTANQSMHVFGAWGKPFKVFANYTNIKPKGDREADFSGFIPRVFNYGVTFTKSGFMVLAKWHRRTDVAQGLIPALGPDARAYVKGRTILDLNVSYQLRSGTSIFLNARNALSERVDYLRYGSQTPEYAAPYALRSYGGAIFDLGVKGRF